MLQYLVALLGWYCQPWIRCNWCWYDCQRSVTLHLSSDFQRERGLTNCSCFFPIFLEFAYSDSTSLCTHPPFVLNSSIEPESSSSIFLLQPDSQTFILSFIPHLFVKSHISHTFNISMIIMNLLSISTFKRNRLGLVHRTRHDSYRNFRY